jgi:negative regulator of genetic competence, sporulation and motility
LESKGEAHYSEWLLLEFLTFNDLLLLTKLRGVAGLHNKLQSFNGSYVLSINDGIISYLFPAPG